MESAAAAPADKNGGSCETSPPPPPPPLQSQPQQQQQLSRYELQKRRDWNTFLQYLKNHKPPLSLAHCSGAHVLEFLKYLDQFGKTKVHVSSCTYFGHPNPPVSCSCPLKQAWGSLDALIGRLRAAYEENGGQPESNPFAAKAISSYLREVRGSQAKARGIPYEKKRRRVATTTVKAGGDGGGSQDQSNSLAGGAGDGSAGAVVEEVQNAPAGGLSAATT